MAEPSSTAVIVGTGVSYAATMLLGPILGEYAVIIAAGLLGALIALAENNLSKPAEGADPEVHAASYTPLQKFLRALLFVFRGVTLSTVFSGLLSFAVAKMVPADWGITPLALLAAVSFVIGWSSDRMGRVKDGLIDFITGLIRK